MGTPETLGIQAFARTGSSHGARMPTRVAAAAPRFRRLAALVACAQFAVCASAWAQDRAALQAASLFAQSCVKFAGHADLLRRWIGDRGLPQLPPDQALPFDGGRPGQVYVANSPEGKMALVSEDNGACYVIVENGTPAEVESAVIATLAKSGVSTSLTRTRRSPDGAATQSLYKASLDSRHWLISVTSHAHPDVPDAPPEIILVATAYGR